MAKILLLLLALLGVSTLAIAAPAIDDTATKPRVGKIPPGQKEVIRDRIASKNSTYLGFGGTGFSNLGEGSMAYGVSGGLRWETTPQAEIKLTSDFATSGTSRYLLSGILGLDYFLTDEDVAPYAGAGFGFGIAHSSSCGGMTNAGFAGQLGVGLQLFRTSSTHFDFFLGYTGVFNKNTLGTPGAFSFRVGVLF